MRVGLFDKLKKSDAMVLRVSPELLSITRYENTK